MSAERIRIINEINALREKDGQPRLSKKQEKEGLYIMRRWLDMAKQGLH